MEPKKSMLFTAENVVTAGSKKWIQKMEINLKDIENYYNRDDWRLFDPNDFNTVTTLNVKDFNNSDNDHLDQVDLYIQKIKNRPF
jgi:thymidylate synthase